MNTYSQSRKAVKKKVVGSSLQEDEFGDETLFETIVETPVEFHITIEDFGHMQVIKTKETAGKPVVKHVKHNF
jgi:hypothetical protein